MRVLMVGCAAGAGDLDACDEKDDAWLAKALHASLGTYARQNRVSLIVFKDFPAKYRPALESLRSNGYARIPSMPMTRLVLHYHDWDEYFRTLSKATRKDLRRKFRNAERAFSNSRTQSPVSRRAHRGTTRAGYRLRSLPRAA